MLAVQGSPSMNLRPVAPDDQSIKLCLSNLYRTLERFTLAIKVFGKRCKTHQRSSNDILASSKIMADYNNKLIYLKCKWDPDMRQLFSLLKDPSMYETLANDIIVSLNESWKKSKLPDELYRLAIEAIITPIIEDLMCEEKIGRAGLILQTRRKQFVSLLIPNLSYTEATHESIQVLDILMDAITRHCNRIAKPDADYYELIHHIVNITYVFHLVKDRLGKIRLQIRSDLNEEILSPTVAGLKELIEKFEDDLSRNLNLFEAGHEMSILVDNLRVTLIEVRLLKSLMK